MKKAIALLVAMLLLVLCSACSNQEDSPKTAGSSDSANSVTTESSAATEEPQSDTFAVGNVITFGRYEQDNNLENGPEPIEWIVLDYDEANHKAFLLSLRCLEAKQFHTANIEVTWETSALRAWLNNDFLNQAFNAEEQSAIQISDVDNSDAQGYDWTLAFKNFTNRSGGNNTKDKVFLLSYAEANKYLGVTWEKSSDPARSAPTAYAVAHGAETFGAFTTTDGKPSGYWWLRSPGEGKLVMSTISAGSLSFIYVSSERECARPALWLNLESGI